MRESFGLGAAVEESLWPQQPERPSLVPCSGSGPAVDFRFRALLGRRFLAVALGQLHRELPGFVEKGVCDESDVPRITPERARVVERRGQRENSPIRNARRARLVADNPAKRRGPDDRPAGLSAKRAEAHSQCHGGGGTARRSSRRSFKIPRVTGRGRVNPGKLGGHRLPQDHRACGAKPLDNVGILRGDPFTRREESATTRQPFDINDVLDAKRHAVQWTAIVTGGEIAVERLGLFNRPRTINQHPGIHATLPLVDPVETAVQDLNTRDFAAAKAFAEAFDRLVRERVEGHETGIPGLQWKRIKRILASGGA